MKHIFNLLNCFIVFLGKWIIIKIQVEGIGLHQKLLNSNVYNSNNNSKFFVWWQVATSVKHHYRYLQTTNQAQRNTNDLQFLHNIIKSVSLTWNQCFIMNTVIVSTVTPLICTVIVLAHNHVYENLNKPPNDNILFY